MLNEIGSKKNKLDTPVLWVDLDTLDRNITGLAERFKTAGVNWRPHIKGIKIPTIAHKAIIAGAIGITCAKLGEAEVMAAAGIDDILIANQIVGPMKITRLVNLCRHAHVKVAVDNEDNVAELGQAAREKGIELGVVVELDTGMHRAGVEPGQPAVELSRIVHRTPGLRYLGLMAWEGHTADMKDPDEKQREIVKSVNLLAESAQSCREAGLPVSIVSGGGSATYRFSLSVPGLTEIQAGGAVFNDVIYRAAGVETQPCLFVRATVSSRPRPDRIVFDAGFKAMPGSGVKPEPIGLPPVRAIQTYAEHTVLTLEEPTTSVKVGDAFDFMVAYGDTTVFLHDLLYGIRGETVEVVWAIQARGKLR